jgi:hypothetical protein
MSGWRPIREWSGGPALFFYPKISEGIYYHYPVIKMVEGNDFGDRGATHFHELPDPPPESEETKP